MRVLITGASGFVGRRLTPYLGERHEVIAADLHPPDLPGARTLDITRLSEAEEACEDVEAVVHLAVASGHEGEYEDEVFNALRFQVNVWGTRNVFEAAVRQGVERVVYTSSLMVMWGYGEGEYVGADAEARPVGTYALSKHLGEVIARDYWLRYGLPSFSLRIAKPVDPSDPATRRAPIRPQWIAFPDLLRAYELALTAPLERAEVLHLVGESSRRRWDLSAAQRLLGYMPEYRLEDLGYRLGSETC